MAKFNFHLTWRVCRLPRCVRCVRWSFCSVCLFLLSWLVACLVHRCFCIVVALWQLINLIFRLPHHRQVRNQSSVACVNYFVTRKHCTNTRTLLHLWIDLWIFVYFNTLFIFSVCFACTFVTRKSTLRRLMLLLLRYTNSHSHTLPPVDLHLDKPAVRVHLCVYVHWKYTHWNSPIRTRSHLTSRSAYFCTELTCSRRFLLPYVWYYLVLLLHFLVSCA